MPVYNPQKTAVPAAVSCGGSAAVTISFDAAASLSADPADIILILDRSCSMAPPRIDYAKAAANQFIDIVAGASSGSTAIGNGSRIGLVSFSGEARADVPLSENVSALRAAIRSLHAADSTNHEAAFLTAERMLRPKGTARQIIVLFTDGVSTNGGDASVVTDRLKAAGVEIYCIGLGRNRDQINVWASSPIATHVTSDADPGRLERMFRKIADEVILSGAHEAVLREKVTEDFEITGLGTPTHGTAQITGPQTIVWTPGTVGVREQPERVSLTFTIRHIGNREGRIPVNESLSYRDRECNRLVFPTPTLEIRCGGGEVDPEPCPEPTVILIPGCQDAVHAELTHTVLMSLGRILQLDLTIRAVCPGKRVAVSIILTEIGKHGAEHPRGVKHLLIPAQTFKTCQDVTLRCIPFSLPEALDASGRESTICNPRKFAARVIANYVDTDFACCDSDPVCI